MRKTKMICTMGPAVDDYKVLKEVAKEMDVARFNFSHGSHEEHKKRLEMIKKVRKDLNRPIASLLDTKGPEIRTGQLENGEKVLLKENQMLILTTKDIIGNSNIIHVNYKNIIKDVKKGQSILIDDGLIELKVLSVSSTQIECMVMTGGELGERKGLNIPNTKISLPDLTSKDIEDIKFGIKEGFDFIAASFVRSASCIKQIKKIIRDNHSSIQVIAKIENSEGIENIDEIIKEADGIMVARGDLGVEIPIEQIPKIQKNIVRKCNENSKIVIIATQMLDSMIKNKRPTRAEATDVANAVYDGTDCVMLSGETAAGKYPIEAVKTMSKIVSYTESNINYIDFNRRRGINPKEMVLENIICEASIEVADRLNVKAILAPTNGGFTAKYLSKCKPHKPIYALTPFVNTQRKMMIYFGVQPILLKRANSSDELVNMSILEMLKLKKINSGDLVLVTAGISPTHKTKLKAYDYPKTNGIRIVVA
ncbi:MAG: pyruvate kinase [Eubacteriales bacterium]|nr:pyruvate kinase [Eubacteriales bacterium]